MTENIINYESSVPAYYKHSGKVPIVAGLAMSTFGFGTALILGPLYAYVETHPPFGGYITFLITIATAFALGMVLTIVVKGGQIRNPAFALCIAGLSVFILLTSAWGAWVYGLFQMAHAKFPLLHMLTHPRSFLRLLVAINTHGAWSFRNIRPTGLFLLSIWAIEAAILVAIPIRMVYTAVTEEPFCEHCKKWCSSEVLIRLDRGDASKIRSRLAARDFGSLLSLEQASPYARVYWKLYFHGCSKCDTTQTLCLDDIVLTPKSNSRNKIKRVRIVDRLIVTPNETVVITSVVARLSAPVPDETAPLSQVASVPQASISANPESTPAPAKKSKRSSTAAIPLLSRRR